GVRPDQASLRPPLREADRPRSARRPLRPRRESRGIPRGHGAGPGILAGRLAVLRLEAPGREAAVAEGRARGRPGDLRRPRHPPRYQLRRLRRRGLPAQVWRSGLRRGVWGVPAAVQAGPMSGYGRMMRIVESPDATSVP